MIETLSLASGRTVSRETFAKLEKFAELLIQENSRQNLISRSTIDELWNRHIVDGAQLIKFADRDKKWCDVGSGPGLPGIVISIITGDPTTLVEPRRKRVEFLEAVKDELGLSKVVTVLGRSNQVREKFDYITARAVAPLDELLGLTSHLAHSGTKWILPKGVKAKSELDDARRTWQGRFELVPSVTSPEASIVIAEGVQPKGKR